MPDSRIYLVKSVKAAPPVTRLVRAANASQALRHVVSSYFTVDLASQDDCVTLAAGGAKVETAGEGE